MELEFVFTDASENKSKTGLLALRALQDLAAGLVAAGSVARSADSEVDVRLASNLELLGEVLGVVSVGPEASTASAVVLASTGGGAASGDVAEVLSRVEGVAGAGTDSIECVAGVVASWATRVRPTTASLLRVWLSWLIVSRKGGRLIRRNRWDRSRLVRNGRRQIRNGRRQIRDGCRQIRDGRRLIRNASGTSGPVHG